LTWLALRLLRPYLFVAAAITVTATAYIWYGAGVVQRQLDAAGKPGCLNPNLCYPRGSALDAVFGMELIAAFVPSLLGLVIGVALFSREHEEGTVAFVLAQSVSRRRWVITKFGWALAAGLLCATVVATAHRLVATRYTLLANDTYELLQMLHLNNIAYMTAQTATVVAFAGLVGLMTGRTLRTLVVSVFAGPFVFLAAMSVTAVLANLLWLLLGSPDSPAAADPNPFVADLYTLDPFAYLTSVVAAIGVVATVLAAARVRIPEPQ
jgi:ABC-type transport system involved in multi-copper enzyme maturation permease subunit